MQFWVLFYRGPKYPKWWRPYVPSSTWSLVIETETRVGKNQFEKLFLGEMSLTNKQRRKRWSLDGQEICVAACWFIQDAKAGSMLYWIHSASPTWCIRGVRIFPGIWPQPFLSSALLTTIHCCIIAHKLKQIKKTIKTKNPKKTPIAFKPLLFTCWTLRQMKQNCMQEKWSVHLCNLCQLDFSSKIKIPEDPHTRCSNNFKLTRKTVKSHFILFFKSYFKKNTQQTIFALFVNVVLDNNAETKHGKISHNSVCVCSFNVIFWCYTIMFQWSRIKETLIRSYRSRQ